MRAPDLVLPGVGVAVSRWRDSNPRPLRSELRAERSMEVVSARRGPLVGTLRWCRSTRLLYFAAVQQWTIRHPGLVVRGWCGQARDLVSRRMSR
jgi:hypothetical protein